MKIFLKHIQRKINNIPENTQKMVFSIGESIAIVKKKKLFKNIKWSKNEVDCFNAFWKSNYGKKIKPYWHKLYQSMNGTYNEKYFPEKLYSTKLEPLLNPYIYSKLFCDKNLLDVLFGTVKEVRLPETYFCRISGTYYDKNRNVINETDIEKILNNYSSCVIKPTMDTSSGNDVEVIQVEDKLCFSDLLSKAGALISSDRDLIVQEKIINSKELSNLHPYSLNTIRITSYRINSKYYVVPFALRIGVDKQSVDNVHAGGLGIGIKEDGTLNDFAYKLDRGNKCEKFYSHPTTNVKFSGYYIANTNKLTEAAIALHKMIPQLGIVSWDLTLDNKNRIVLIEANCRGQAVWFPQIIYGKPFFGENTHLIIKMISNN